MNFLVVGSGRFIAPKLLSELVELGHEVAFFDPLPPAGEIAGRVKHIVGDKSAFAFYKEECLEFKPDVAIHLSAATRDEASNFLEVFSGEVASTVVTSNTNVYLAHARFRKTEPGPALAVPIMENSDLRAEPLLGEEPGDKLEVEEVLLSSKVPCTVLRCAPTYGPSDFLRRFYPMIVRMVDQRPFVLVGSLQAEWLCTHLYVDNAAHAIALAATSPCEKHRIYNVGEANTPTTKERLENLGTVLDWEGVVKVVADSQLPDYLNTPGDFSQDLQIDSSAIRKDLGYRELGDYYEDLAEAAEWYRLNPPRSMAGKVFSYEAEDELGQKWIR